MLPNLSSSIKRLVIHNSLKTVTLGNRDTIPYLEEEERVQKTASGFHDLLSRCTLLNNSVDRSIPLLIINSFAFDGVFEFFEICSQRMSIGCLE
ncbi:hypothetical protein CEXT_159301 [Caerostris extrusa]|uniref:Uncharacterized protein n=1 Tax=Caerostris extrusa TaxID=172846 RepID=A0AAV4P1D9_CAEEX|nr:hypothetical protein CEXT_159301 [Caerostris extrusa]